MCVSLFSSSDDAKEAYQAFLHECGNLDRRLNSICENPPSSMNIEDYSPRICVSTVPERFQAFLPTLAKRLNSKVFCNMLEKTACSKNILPEDKWWEVLVSVWHEAETEWTNACDAMRTGTITLQEAEKLFSLFEKNNKWFEKCEREVQLMAAGGTDSWVEERMEQFQCLSRLSTQRDVAGTLCQIKEEFGYTGDLKDICTIQDVVSLTIEYGIHTSVETVLTLCVCSQHFCCVYWLLQCLQKSSGHRHNSYSQRCCDFEVMLNSDY